MDEQHKHALETLQHELHSTKPANEDVKARIETIKQEMSKTVGASGQTAESKESLRGLRETLEDSIDDFAAHHPSLAEAVRVAVDTLVNAGA